MAFSLFISFNQDPGVGQGYYSAVEPLGTSGLIRAINFSGELIRLVVTRYAGLPPVEVDVSAASEYSFAVGNIQTIGILNLGGGIASGFLEISFPG